LGQTTVSRFNYARIADACEMPNLLDVQLYSYNGFLQLGVPPEKRENVGLHQIFKEIFPTSTRITRWITSRTIWGRRGTQSMNVANGI
jgi:DNA-directed RNA polymerase beta subunit